MNLTLKSIVHRGKKRLAILFHYYEDLIAKVGTIKNRRWSQSQQVWHVSDTEESHRPKTTMLYTHVSGKRIREVHSPFDDLEI